jgi:hypothetical protein
MKKKYLLSFALILFVFSGFSQNLEKVAEIEVSKTSKVFTYKLVGVSGQNVQDDNAIEIDKTQNETIKRFLAIKGVESADFDPATATFTVVAKKETIIKLPLNAKYE